ncbi:MAG: cbb3-type cytochrome c oxidase subunit 3 [Gammaproteobacteria bacterium]|nr:cbb3-type cytochrome c oxidase subunit 3 [Gammaproteobacteria bacterium]
MSSLGDYFATDWSAMTVQDWIGTILTVVVFLLMIGLFFTVFRPKNRERLESRRHIPFEDGDENGEPRESGDKR